MTFDEWWDRIGFDFCHGLNQRETAMAGWRAATDEEEPFDWPNCPLCSRPLNVCHREGCTALSQARSS
jgi:hypothetical protein